MTTERPSRGRSVLVAVLGILACIAITISATTLWVHQIALNTDRYVSIVSPIASDPAVIEEVSTTLAERVTDRIVNRIDLPPVVVPLLESWLQEQIASFMASEAFAEGWTEANRLAHAALVRILRSEAILPEEPVTMSISELIVIGMDRLQEAGVIPDDVQLPDRSDSAAMEAIRQILADRLDIEVPPDFGEITLSRSERLETARQFVRIFDIVTVVSVLVAVALVALTIWLARNRLRAVLLLGIGTVLALLAAVASTSVFSGIVANAIADTGATATIGALVNALLGNLATALVVVLVVGALTTLAIVLIGRTPAPAEAMAVASPYPAPLPPPPTVEPPPPLPPSPPPAVFPEVSGAPATEPAAQAPAPKRATKAAPKAAAKPTAKPPTKPTAKPAAKKPRTAKGPPAST
jgi:hypothetical protein